MTQTVVLTPADLPTQTVSKILSVWITVVLSMKELSSSWKKEESPKNSTPCCQDGGLVTHCINSKADVFPCEQQFGGDRFALCLHFDFCFLRFALFLHLCALHVLCLAFWEKRGFYSDFFLHVCVPPWLSTVFPISSLPPATACEQSVCGRPPGQPQRCSALKNSSPGEVQQLFRFPVHPSRCSPLHCPFRCTQYILQRLLLIASIGTFFNPSHFVDV